MGYKVTYTYKAYPDCPEATEISKSRAEGERFLSSIFLWGCLIALIVGIGSISKNVLEGILLILGSAGGFAFYFFVALPWYSKNTQKIIDQVLIDHEVKQRVKEQEKKESEKLIEDQREKAIQAHDTDKLVKLNQNKSWTTKEQIIVGIEAHRKWRAGDPDGKQLFLFAEEIRDVDLRNLSFEDATFSHCLFYGLNLDGVHFRDCNLLYSHFEKCQLENTSFDGSNIEGVRFD